MKRYTEFIPSDLQADFVCKFYGFGNIPTKPMTYAEVLDRCVEKDINIAIMPKGSFVTGEVKGYLPVVQGTSYDFRTNWFDAANTAIKQAIKLLEDTK